MEMGAEVGSGAVDAVRSKVNGGGGRCVEVEEWGMVESNRADKSFVYGKQPKPSLVIQTCRVRHTLSSCIS